MNAAQAMSFVREHGVVPSGRHVNRAVAYPEWAPPQIFAEAKFLSEPEAASLLGVARWA